jgi:hypothetical protein
MEFSEMEHSIDRLWVHINKLESRLNSALDRLEKSIDKDVPKKDLKARDIPLGTKVKPKDSYYWYEIIAYSKMGDQVVVIEDEEGNLFTENINDLEISD